jgi:chorismate mutase
MSIEAEQNPDLDALSFEIDQLDEEILAAVTRRAEVSR